MDAKQRRCDRQPACFLIAQELCCTSMTDGFCSPKNTDVCLCWANAEQLQRITGLSANACVWVLKRRKQIEAAAALGVDAARNTVDETRNEGGA